MMIIFVSLYHLWVTTLFYLLMETPRRPNSEGFSIKKTTSLSPSLPPKQTCPPPLFLVSRKENKFLIG